MKKKNKSLVKYYQKIYKKTNGLYDTSHDCFYKKKIFGEELLELEVIKRYI